VGAWHVPKLLELSPHSEALSEDQPPAHYQLLINIMILEQI